MDQDYKGFVQKAPDQIIKHLPSDARLTMNWHKEAIITLEVFLQQMALKSTSWNARSLTSLKLTISYNSFC